MSRRILVGMLLLGALLIFALGTFYIENWERYVRKGYEVKARFTTAHTLAVGDEVRMAGVEVGRVGVLRVETDKPVERPVEAALWMQPGVKLRAKDVARVETRSVFGGSFISITREDPEAPVLKDGDELENTEVQPSITELISKVGSTLDDAKATVAKAGDALDGLSQTFKNLEEITTGLEPESLQATMQSAQKAFEGIEELIAELREGEGMLPRLIRDEEGYAKLETTMESVRTAFEGVEKLITELREGEGIMAKLISDKESSAKFEATLESSQKAFAGIEKLAADLREGEGLMAKLIADEELAAKVDQIAADAQVFAAAMAELSENMESSSLGQLMTTDDAHQKLIAALDELKNSAEAIGQERGALGRLIHDDTLYKQLTGALASVQNLIDDYREQSPILTFAGAIFGAF